jgi:hypothetical protein
LSFKPIVRRTSDSTRKLVVPSRPPLFKFQGWALYRHPSTPKDSPLWPTFKLVNLAKAGLPRQRGGGWRAFWLYWGVDPARLRRSKYSRRLLEDHPAVYQAVVAWLAAHATPAWAEAQLGAEQLKKERARLAVSMYQHAYHDRRRYDAAHAAALEEDSKKGS